ncbi:PREDICTED: uncharacterized protein LOC103328784 [Prunus mume]|uniref:Uncharacterized protein LOC103328784 n=1 Tax=Prunus mume TaxID=102107 RepID=A0ABM0NT29_PRUMU|nr:PREDICTED: uncharacterized protein LOC103328784 [Prunus mume]
MQGALLSLKQQRAGMASLLDIDDPNFVRISVALTFFGGSSIGHYILEASPNSNWGKFMSRLSLLFGALTYILVLGILLPALEIPSLLFWIICFVSFIAVSSYPYLKTLFTGAVGAFENLQENVKNMIIARCFTSEQSGHVQQIPGSVPAQIEPPMLESPISIKAMDDQIIEDEVPAALQNQQYQNGPHNHLDISDLCGLPPNLLTNGNVLPEVYSWASGRTMSKT